MDCMYSAWGSLELASKCQKPVVVTLLVWCLTAWGVLPGGLGFFGTCFKVPKTSSSDAIGVVPNGLGCAAWRLGVCCQVISENQRSLKRMALGGKCDPAKQKRSGRGARECVAPSIVR